MSEFDYEGPVRDAQGWADAQDHARGSSAVGAAVKGVLVLGEFDPNAACTVRVKRSEKAASVAVKVDG